MNWKIILRDSSTHTGLSLQSSTGYRSFNRMLLILLTPAGRVTKQLTFNLKATKPSLLQFTICLCIVTRYRTIY